MCSMSLSLPWPPRGQAPGRGSMRARPWRGAPPVTAAPETPWELRRRSAEALKGFAPSLQNWAWPSENMLKSSLKAQLKSSSKPERHSKTLCLPQLSRTAFHESIGLKHLPQSSLSAPWPNEAVEPREPFSSSSELVRLRPQASSQPAQATKGYKRIQKARSLCLATLLHRGALLLRGPLYQVVAASKGPNATRLPQAPTVEV